MAIKKANGEGSVNRYKNGWRATITIGRDKDGKLIRKQLYGKTKKEVLEKLNSYKNDLDKGLDYTKNSLILKDFLIYWLYDYKKNEIAISTFKLYEDFIIKYINPALGNKKLTELKPHTIQMFYNNSLKNNVFSVGYAIKLHKVFKSALKYAIDHSYIVHDPIKNISLPKNKQAKVIRAFTREEQSMLIDAFNTHKHGLIFKLTLGTGLRQGEVLALKWTDIEDNIIHVSRTLKRSYSDSDDEDYLIEGDLKTPSSYRDVPIPSNILKELYEYKAKFNLPNEGYVFCKILRSKNNLVNPFRPVQNDSIRKAFIEILNSLDIQDATFHTLRHTYATRLLESNVNIKTIQVLLGHSNINITADTYTHVLKDEKVKATDQINSFFE